MKRRKARRICRAIGKSSVAVVGDLMLDRYYWGRVDRISPEGCPVDCLDQLDSAFVNLLGSSALTPGRRAVAGLRGRLAYRARASRE